MKTRNFENNKTMPVEQRKLRVQKWLDICLCGVSAEDAALIIGSSSRSLYTWAKLYGFPWPKEALEATIPNGPWQHTVRGKTWKDMPGTNETDRKLNFFFFRRKMPILNINGTTVKKRPLKPKNLKTAKR